MTPRDYPDAWAQLYAWLGYHRGAAVDADTVLAKMRALAGRRGASEAFICPECGERYTDGCCYAGEQ